ncbi:MAG TPA: hypothetical protein IAC62_05465 [Candidatus Pelethocola excrementipullorum]|nr:hypothetical protein [Candidatus Pelethocola excrementipullorum]
MYIFSINIVFVILIASICAAAIASVAIRIRHAMKTDEKNQQFAAEFTEVTVKSDGSNQKKVRQRYV